MAESLNGMWISDGHNDAGYDDFCKAMGLKDDVIAMYKAKKTTLVYSNTADTFTCDAGMEGVGSKVYTSKFGESYETVGLDGSPATMMVTFKDGVMTEVASSSIANQKVITETRVENGEMIKIMRTEDGKHTITNKFIMC